MISETHNGITSFKNIKIENNNNNLKIKNKIKTLKIISSYKNRAIILIARSFNNENERIDNQNKVEEIEILLYSDLLTKINVPTDRLRNILCECFG